MFCRISARSYGACLPVWAGLEFWGLGKQNFSSCCRSFRHERKRALCNSVSSSSTRASKSLLAGAGRGAQILVLGTYGTLALIPTSFVIAAGFHWVVGHPQQVTRAYLFFAWTGFLCLPFSMVLLLSYPVAKILDPERRALLDHIQRSWARLTVKPFFTPKFEGLDKVETLAHNFVPVVYVSNHQSWTDIYSLLCMPVPIRFVSKEEIFYIPVVGWVMELIGHVGVKRGNKRSRGAVIDACVQKLNSGVSVFLFAEGTRSRDGFVQPFRKGAFIIATEAKVPVVPISISGTGKLMPANRGETWLECGEECEVLIKIHDMIDPSKFTSSEELQNYTRSIIEAGVVMHNLET